MHCRGHFAPPLCPHPPQVYSKTFCSNSSAGPLQDTAHLCLRLRRKPDWAAVASEVVWPQQESAHCAAHTSSATALSLHLLLVAPLPRGRPHCDQLLCSSRVDADAAVQVGLGRTHLDRHPKALHSNQVTTAAPREWYQSAGPAPSQETATDCYPKGSTSGHWQLRPVNCRSLAS